MIYRQWQAFPRTILHALSGNRLESPPGYLLQRRLEHVERLLRDTQLPLSQVAQAVGFSDQSHLARHFRRLTGMPPSRARWKERGIET